MSRRCTNLAMMASLLEAQPLEAGLCAVLSLLQWAFPDLQARQHPELWASSFWQGAHEGLGPDLKSDLAA